MRHSFTIFAKPATRAKAEVISDYLGYLMPQVEHALAGHPELIDVKSDRLLWLLWAGSQAQPPPENVMLIVECALLTSETPAVRGGVMLLGQITPPKHAAELLDLLNRANAFLDSHGMSDNEAAETTERLAQRLGRVSDDDL